MTLSFEIRGHTEKHFLALRAHVANQVLNGIR